MALGTCRPSCPGWRLRGRGRTAWTSSPRTLWSSRTLPTLSSNSITVCCPNRSAKQGDTCLNSGTNVCRWPKVCVTVGTLGARFCEVSFNDNMFSSITDSNEDFYHQPSYWHVKATVCNFFWATAPSIASRGHEFCRDPSSSDWTETQLIGGCYPWSPASWTRGAAAVTNSPNSFLEFFIFLKYSLAWHLNSLDLITYSNTKKVNIVDINVSGMCDHTAEVLGCDWDKYSVYR